MRSKFNVLMMGTSIGFIMSIFLLILPFTSVNAQESKVWSEEYDAATGTLHNLSIENSSQGYTGEGYVAGWNRDGQSVDIDIHVPKTGDYTLTFRYSAAAGNATRYLLIGDTYELNRLNFGGTSDWGDWSTVVVKKVHLDEGDHTVSLIFDSSKQSNNWLNYDQLIISELEPEDDEEWGNFEEQADLAQGSLYNNFWSENSKLFNNAYECNNCNGQFHYWWLAHAIDTLIDGYERTNDKVYIERASTLYDGIVQRNRGNIKNHFYDDMLWMGLAVLRLHEYTGDQAHEDAVFTLWDDIKTGWSDEYGGGIAWNKSQLDYKNTPSNAPAVILAARLYQKYGGEDDLNWAKEIYDWQKTTLVDPETGLVWDGINREGNGNIDKNWRFTYNQGVFIGAALELYRITNDSSYMDAALQTADVTVDQFTDHNGIIFEGGSGDGGLFKGILIRYLTDLALENPSRPDLTQLIIENAKSAWNQTKSEETILFGGSWLNKPAAVVDLSQQLSGVMLMEHAALLKKGSDPELLDIPSSVTKNSNGQTSIGFDIKSANGKGYTLYLSETEKNGPYKLYGNVNYDANGVHIKGLTNNKTYWAYIVYTENDVTVAKSKPVQLKPTK